MQMYYTQLYVYFRRTEDYSDNDKPVSPVLPKLLVLTDYSHGTFNLRAGDIVTLIGHDKNG